MTTAVDDERTARLLAGLARSRATGAPWLACAAGVHAVGQRLSSPGTDILLGYDAWPGPAGPTDLALLADLALGASVRASLGLDRRLATVSMTVQLDDVLPDATQLRVGAPRTSSTGEELALAGGSVLSALGQVGGCSAAFVPQARGLAPMPWERPEGDHATPIAVSALTAAERHAVDNVRSAAAPGRSLVEAALLAAVTARAGADDTAQLAPTALLANRGGVVQGGVLLGFSIHAAQLADSGPTELRTAHVEFVAPAGLGEVVTARCAVLRPGRRTRLLRVDLHQAGRLVATTTVLLRSAG